MEKKVSVLLLLCLFSPIALTSCLPRSKPEEQPQPEPVPQRVVVVQEDAVQEVEEDDCPRCPSRCADRCDQEPSDVKVPATAYRTGQFNRSRSITSDADLADALQYGSVVLDFWAPWCGPCKVLSPIIDEFAREFPNVLFVKINVDQHPGIANRYGARSLPTVLFIRDGRVVHKEVGFSGRGGMRSLVVQSFGG